MHTYWEEPCYLNTDVFREHKLRHVTTAQLQAQLVTAGAVWKFYSGLRSLCVDRSSSSSSDVLSGLPGRSELPRRAHKSGAGTGAQLIQLPQVQLVQIVSSAFSQALTQQIKQIVQPVQTPIEFDVAAFEGDERVYQVG